MSIYNFKMDNKLYAYRKKRREHIKISPDRPTAKHAYQLQIKTDNRLNSLYDVQTLRADGGNSLYNVQTSQRVAGEVVVPAVLYAYAERIPIFNYMSTSKSLKIAIVQS